MGLVNGWSGFFAGASAYAGVSHVSNARRALILCGMLGAGKLVAFLSIPFARRIGTEFEDFRNCYIGWGFGVGCAFALDCLTEMMSFEGQDTSHPTPNPTPNATL